MSYYLSIDYPELGHEGNDIAIKSLVLDIACESIFLKIKSTIIEVIEDER